MRSVLRLGMVALSGMLATQAPAQIDPTPRELIQLGYHKEIIGHAPISGYAVYYRNEPHFLRTNLTLRLAIAPVYAEGEIGIKEALGANTDVGFGLSGGGFAYTYNELRRGIWYHQESWTGHGGGVSASVYHLFNPGQEIPLYGILRGSFEYAAYERDDKTAPGFMIPDDQPWLSLRAGVRYGGQEFVLMPDMSMELSAWYEGQFRLSSGPYGYGGDRFVNSSVHLFWGRALLDYTLPKWKHRVGVALNLGTTIHPDRLSAYRVGGMLSLVSEFPYTLPGYYFGELSTRNMVLLNGFYEIPIDRANRWRVGAGASTAMFAYTPGTEQPGHWHSGVAGGLSYRTKNDGAKFTLSYGYGIDAIRSGGRGGHSVAVAAQFDLGRKKTGPPGTQYGPPRENFFQRLMRVF